MKYICSAVAALALNISSLTYANAAPCLRHPEPFKLTSDKVAWFVSLKTGGDGCLQGLRGKTMTLNAVTVLQQPLHGELIIQGTSFRYIPAPEAKTDTFRLSVTGEDKRVAGTSEIAVEVAVVPAEN